MLLITVENQVVILDWIELVTLEIDVFLWATSLILTGLGPRSSKLNSRKASDSEFIV